MNINEQPDFEIVLFARINSFRFLEPTYWVGLTDWSVIHPLVICQSSIGLKLQAKIVLFVYIPFLLTNAQQPKSERNDLSQSKFFISTKWQGLKVTVSTSFW